MNMKKPNEFILEDKYALYRMTVGLVVPMTLQNLFNVGITTVDVMMLGKVSEAALSGASLAGQVQYIMNMFYFGLTSGASILTAQYWGKHDVRTIEKVFGMSLCFSLCVGILFFGTAKIIPSHLIKIFTKDSLVIQNGTIYLQIISWSYPLVAFTMIYLNLMRSVERVMVTTLTYLVSLIVNTVCKAILIFGFGEIPAMGVRGAAYATVFARAVELLIVVVYMNYKENPISLRWKDFIIFDRPLLKDCVMFSIPVILNEFMWGLGMSVNTAIIGHLGSAAVAANSVAQAARELLMVAGTGLASATAVIIGKTIGEQKFYLAEVYARKLTLISVLTTLIVACGLFLFRNWVVRNMAVSAEAKDYLSFMLFVICFYAVAQSYNSIMIVGIFRAGGNIKACFLIDVIIMWLFSLPLGVSLAFLLEAGVKVVFLTLFSDEFIKVPVCAWWYKKKIWLQNVTKDM